ERAEAAKKLKFLAAEEGDLGETLGSGQHGEQAQEQDLIERVGHLAWLARVLEVIEITQKDNCFVECRTACCRAVHCRSPSSESEDRHGFSTLAVCHVLLHPIALQIQAR